MSKDKLINLEKEKKKSTKKKNDELQVIMVAPGVKRLLVYLTVILCITFGSFIQSVDLFYNMKVNPTIGIDDLGGMHNIEGAPSFDVTLDGENIFTKELIIDVAVSNYVNFNSDFLYSLSGIVEYDDSKIDLVSIDALGDSNFSYSGSVNVYNESGIREGTPVLRLTFKNVSMLLGEETTITFKDINGSDGVYSTSIGDVSKRVVIAPFLDGAYYVNDGTVFMDSLTLDKVNLYFDNDKLDYTVTVPNSVTKIRIAGTYSQDTNVTGLGEFVLKGTTTVFNVTAVRADGEERTYTITVNKEDKDTKDVKNNTLILVIATELVVGLLVFCIIVYLVRKIYF